MTTWTPHKIRPLNDKVFVVTGGNSGIGYEAALELARRESQVIIACRSESRATDAVQKIRHEIPGANISSVPLDLADLKSVRGCAQALNDRLERIDGLVNNAGVMA